MTAGFGEAPLIMHEGFGSDPTDDKTGGRFTEIISAIHNAGVDTTGDVAAGGKVTAVGDIEAGGDVTAVANVEAGAKVTAVTDVEAGGEVKAVGDITTSTGGFKASAAGKGLTLKSGANAIAGISGALDTGAVIVVTTAVNTGDLIFLSRAVTGGTLGELSYTISDGTSFTIASSSATETSTVAWMIVKLT